MRPPTRLGAFATLTITLLGLTVAGVAHARWPARPDRAITLTEAGINPTIVGVCTDGSGGAYVAWSQSPTWRVEHLDAFGDDVFAPPVWVADTLVGRIWSIAPDGAGGVIVLGERDAGDAEHDAVTLSRIGAGGERAWSRTLASRPMLQVNGNWEGLERDTVGSATAVVWAEDHETSRLLRVQLCDANGQPLWSAGGVGVATGSPQLLCLGSAPDGLGGFWLALGDFGPGDDFVPRIQHLAPDGTVAWPDTAMTLPAAFQLGGPWQMVPDGSGGLWLSSRSNAVDCIQLVRPDGSLAFGLDGVVPPGPEGQQRVLPSLGALAGGRLVVAWQANETGYYGTHVQLLDSTGRWLWPGDGVLAGMSRGESDVVRAGANADGGATVTLQLDRQVADALLGAQRFDANGLTLWPDPPPVALVASWWQLQNSDGHRFSVPAGDGGVLLFATFSDPDDWGGYGRIRAQHLDGHGRLGDTSPRIVSVRDVPGDLGHVLEVHWKASCLEGDSVMATVAYDVLRGQGGGPGGTAWTVVATLQAAGDTEYVAQVPTLADSSSPGASPTVLRVRSRDAGGREWLSPPAAGASYANSPPLGVAPGTALAFSLAAPEPSPAIAGARVRYTLPTTGRVTLELLDVSGRRVRKIADVTRTAGPHAEAFRVTDDSGRQLPAGLYFVRLGAAGRFLVRRLVVLM